MQKKLQILPNENESIIIKTERQDGMVQHRAIRYTCKIPQYQLSRICLYISILQWTTLQMRRIQTRLVVFYNIIGYTDTLQYTIKIL